MRSESPRSSLVILEKMRLPTCSSLAALLVCAVLCAGTALGQSLSIVKKETNYWIEASAPASNPQTLQASENLQNWVVIREDVQRSEEQTYELKSLMSTSYAVYCL